MRFPRVSSLVALVALLAVGAASCDDDPLPRGLPIAEAERARELALLTIPPVERVTRDAFTAEQAKSGQEASDSRITYLRNTYGRVGFFPPDYDLRPVQGQTSTLYAAFYSSDEKKITLIGEPSESIVLHELVHALQDQHFDLNAYREDVVSSDEAFAKSAMTEGDAVLAEIRHQLTSQGYRPEVAATYVTRSEALRFAKETLEKNYTVAPYFLAQAAFSYTFGPARAVELAVTESARQTWTWEPLNDALRQKRPKTTLSILGQKEDRAVDVGLTRLPSAVAPFYAIDTVDRLGAWYTYLLFYRTPIAPDRLTLALSWTGDQLVVVHRRDTRIGTPSGPSGIVWTSAWSGADDADVIANAISTLHGLERTNDDAAGRSWRAKDGEAVWLERRDTLVSFTKNIPYDDAKVFADRALSSPAQQKTLPIQRRVFEGPRRLPCAALSARRALPP